MVKTTNSRNAKKKKTSSKFITRNQAIKKLQLKLNEFRRLCILKGIFPKEPNKYFKGMNKTYYAVKDIKFLANEKLLSKFREIKSYNKKIKKAINKKQKFDAKLLEEKKPTYSLTSLIKERYPKFSDALNDLDDALCLLGIFSTLPKYDILKISPEKVNMSQRLLREFFLYVCINKNLTKCFISIKGIYLTVVINNQEITWLNPFQHPQKITYDIDYEIMSDFLELYTNLMQFINFKLYKDISVEYPPPVENSDLKFFGFNSINIQQLQEKAVQTKEGLENTENQNEVDINSKEWQKINSNLNISKKLKGLFNNLVFYVSREIPQEIFELVISACGGLFGDDSEYSSFSEDDKRITHYIVDRPPTGIEFKPNKDYVQPQWIFDCINQRKLLPVSDYAPGKKLPSHISPYYSINEEGEFVYEKDENEMDIEEESNGNNKENNKEITKEDKELREMMLSNNKKKLLQKIREEAIKKKKTTKLEKKKTK